MFITHSISVRHKDIFVSRVGLPLASGEVLPPGTTFVCRRGGARCELVYQHPLRGDLIMVEMPKSRIASELRRGVRQNIPLRLAVAFGYPVDHVPRIRPIPGRCYALALPMPSLDGQALPAGTRIWYQPMNGLHVFNIEGRLRNGYPARLVFGDEDLRAIVPVRFATMPTEAAA